MADMSVQVEVEDWVRRTWMSQRFGKEFFRERCALDPGGVFDFDAVSQDRKIVACISTSCARTATGKLGVGKLCKLRADMFFLLLAKGVDKRLMIFTESDMYEALIGDKAKGRVPKNIDLLLADIPNELNTRLGASRAKASSEVSPRRE
jgi:hypothetical protein